ncbi:MAG: hypothetical protein ACYC56_05795 [Candidatus Aquicultor sp.]
MRFNLSKKSLVIIGVIIIAVIAVVGIQRVLASRSPALNADQLKAADTAVNGWTIKNFARLSINQEHVREFKQKLMQFYDADSGELAEQQRLIDGLIAADKATDAKALSTSTPLQLLEFRLASVKLKKTRFSGDEANIVADLEYYIKYDAQHENYSSFAKNTYEWKLKKFKNTWKIVNEDVVKGDDN